MQGAGLSNYAIASILVPNMYIARNNTDIAAIGLKQERSIVIDIRSHALNQFVVLHYCDFAAQHVRSFFPFF